MLEKRGWTMASFVLALGTKVFLITFRFGTNVNAFTEEVRKTNFSKSWETLGIFWLWCNKYKRKVFDRRKMSFCYCANKILLNTDCFMSTTNITLPQKLFCITCAFRTKNACSTSLGLMYLFFLWIVRLDSVNTDLSPIQWSAAMI